MAEKQFNSFCSMLPNTTYVIQWGGSHVWKIGGKGLVIASWNKGKLSGITLKVSDIALEILREQPGLRPAPYLASRGMKWIQNYDEPGLSKKGLKEHLRESYKLVSLSLTKALQRVLGLNQD
ncbi:MAG: hypothetical protein CMF67_05695 [Magnetovibrio sp.]|nr:hypothetical protein [Magnetovibrio sp.]